MISNELVNRLKRLVGRPIEWSTKAARNYDGFLVDVNEEFFTVVNVRFRGLIDASNLEEGKHDMALFPYMRFVMHDCIESVGICHLPRHHLDADVNVEELCDFDSLYEKRSALYKKLLDEEDEEDEED